MLQGKVLKKGKGSGKIVRQRRRKMITKDEKAEEAGRRQIQ